MNTGQNEVKTDDAGHVVLRKDGSPMHPNAIPRKQPANHPFRRNTRRNRFDEPDEGQGEANKEAN
jgi:hypothetical protein